jgi:hypothetical protein
LAEERRAERERPRRVEPPRRAVARTIRGLSTRSRIALTIASLLLLLVPASFSQGLEVARITALRVPSLTAKVISTRPIYRFDPDTQARTPAITSGSGVTRAGWWLFAAQDDSSLVAAKGIDGALETIRIFPAVGGADRFSDVFQNKKLKPDLEAALTVPVTAALARRFGVTPRRGRSTVEAVLLVGSGSKAVLRDRVALIFPAEPVAESKVVPVRAESFYALLRREPALTGNGGDLNLEGVTVHRNGRWLRFYNRGNGRKGSVVGSVDVPLASFLAYLVRAAADPKAPFTSPLSNRRTYDLGRSADGEIVGITDAITLPAMPGAPRGLSGEIHVLSAIVEHTADAVHDGYTSDAAIALELPSGRLLVAPLTGVVGVESLKIEGLSVVSARWVGRPAQLHVNILAVTDSDAKDPDTPSTLARVEVTFQP